MPSIRKAFRNKMDAIARDPTPPSLPNNKEPEPNYEELYTQMMMVDQSRNVLDVYHSTLLKEVQKRKEAEVHMHRFKDLYEYYRFEAGKLETMLGHQQRMAMKRDNGFEEGQSSTSVQDMELDATCGHCHNELANMVWLPCRHLCVCMNCDDKVMDCLLCDARKVTSFKVDWNKV